LQLQNGYAVGTDACAGLYTDSPRAVTKFLGLSRKEHPYARLRSGKGEYVKLENSQIQACGYEIHKMLQQIYILKDITPFNF